GAFAIALIGLANVVGSLMAGWAGSRYPKKYLLSGIYLARTTIASAFILSPITPESVVIFSLLLGSRWLAAVPRPSGAIGYICGLRYVGTPYGVALSGRQLGRSLGIWLGGMLHDVYGNYTRVWWTGAGAGAFRALIHLPARERSVA